MTSLAGVFTGLALSNPVVALGSFCALVFCLVVIGRYGDDDVGTLSMKTSVSSILIPLERLPVEALIDPPSELDDHLAVILNPERFSTLVPDLRPGLLLTGPPGTGKTACVRAAALRLKANLLHLKNADIVSSYNGQTELKLATHLKQAQSLARTSEVPTLLFIDELDLMVPSRSQSSTSDTFTDRRVLDSFLQFMDGLDKSTTKRLTIIACTNRPDNLDAALASRFGASIEFTLPARLARRTFCAQRLQKLSHAVPAADIDWLAQMTPTFNYRELHTLLNKAGLQAVSEKVTAITTHHVRAAHREVMQRKAKAARLAQTPRRMPNVRMT